MIKPKFHHEKILSTKKIASRKKKNTRTHRTKKFLSFVFDGDEPDMFFHCFPFLKNNTTIALFVNNRTILSEEIFPFFLKKPP